jgi:hypothetical protein
MIRTVPGLEALFCDRGLVMAASVLGVMLAFPDAVLSRQPYSTYVSASERVSAAGHLYMSGGINFDQRRAMERAASGYNLKLVFANHVGTPAMPSFLIIGANDGSPIEKISLHGPWFYIQLPAGSYTILVQFKHHTALVRDVHLRRDRQRTYVFRGVRGTADGIGDN